VTIPKFVPDRNQTLVVGVRYCDPNHWAMHTSYNFTTVELCCGYESMTVITQHPNGSTNVHNQKRLKKTKKEKSRYNILGLAIVIHPPPRQNLKYRFYKSDASKK
jgi:hypothetical protein